MVLDTVSSAYSSLLGRFLYITHPYATLLIPKNFLVRLACVKHTASVRSEPGSYSQIFEIKFKILILKLFVELTFAFSSLVKKSTKINHSFKCYHLCYYLFTTYSL